MKTCTRHRGNQRLENAPSPVRTPTMRVDTHKKAPHRGLENIPPRTAARGALGAFENCAVPSADTNRACGYTLQNTKQKLENVTPRGAARQTQGAFGECADHRKDKPHNHIPIGEVQQSATRNGVATPRLISVSLS